MQVFIITAVHLYINFQWNSVSQFLLYATYQAS